MLGEWFLSFPKEGGEKMNIVLAGKATGAVSSDGLTEITMTVEEISKHLTPEARIFLSELTVLKHWNCPECGYVSSQFVKPDQKDYIKILLSDWELIKLMIEKPNKK